MNLKQFMEAESKNSPLKPNSPLCRDIMSKIRTIIDKGGRAGIVIQGTAYWVEKKDGEAFLTKMKNTD